MADIIAAQKRYLEARLKECASAPELNRHQIVEYKKYLQMLASSGDAAEYADKIAISGDMFSIGQAEQLDRYTNLIEVKRRFGDEIGAKGLEACLDAAKSATSHADLYDKMQAATKEASEAAGRAHQALNRVENFIGVLIAAHVRCKKDRADANNAVKRAWADLKAADPAITWEKLTSYRPYRSIIIFDDARMAQLKKYFEEACA